MPLTPELMRRQAEEAFGMPLEEARAAQLADEIGLLNDNIAGLAETTLGLFDEPAQFAAVLERLHDRWES
jgi:hypothetical protein